MSPDKVNDVTEPNSNDSLATNDLEGLTATEGSDGTISLHDPVTGFWVARLEPHTVEPLMVNRGSASATVPIVQGLADALPELSRLLSKSSGDAAKSVGYQVVFSPAVQRGLNNGTLRLMQGSRGAIPNAINASGQVVEKAVVAGTAVTSASGSVAKVGGTSVAVGGTAAVATAALPVVLIVGAGVAASYAQQRWLEKAFENIQASLDRIETRLRDDDLGALEAADNFINLIVDSISMGSIPDQLRLELSTIQNKVDSIYFSRRRFVERYKGTLEERQTSFEVKKDRTSAWAGKTAKELSDDDLGIMDELIVFTQAMVTRARVTSASAMVLANDGAASEAVQRIEQLRSAMRRDYFDLHNRVSALARHEPESNRWQQMTDRGSKKSAVERVTMLAEAMDAAIGSSLPDDDEQLTLPVFSVSDLTLR